MATKEVLDLIEQKIGPLEQQAHRMLDTRAAFSKRISDVKHRLRILQRATGH